MAPDVWQAFGGVFREHTAAAEGGQAGLVASHRATSKTSGGLLR